MQNASLFAVLREEGLTTLRINYGWRTDKAVLSGAREWEDDVKWSDYSKKFYGSSALTSNNVHLSDRETRETFQKHSSLKYLESVINLMRNGRHCLIECYYWKKKDVRFVSNVHNDVLGLNNRRHAIRAGGIRRHEPDEDEYDVIIDGLNLARAMTFKNAAARIPYGGSKLTVMSDPVDLEDMDEIGFLSYAVDRSRLFTGPDMGYPLELADVMQESYTRNITGGSKGPLGPTGTPTAYGVYLAAKQAAKFRFGSDSLKGRRIAVQGLGAVGLPLAGHYVGEGAQLVVTDVDEEAVANLRSKYPEASIDVVEPDEIYSVGADVFSPCAIGGILTEDRIPELKFKIIIGGANNTLKATSQEEEYELARALDKAGILYQIDWWHNVGGVICGAEEYEKQEDASMDNVLAKIGEICTQDTWENLNRAKELGITPTESAYGTVEKMIYG